MIEINDDVMNLLTCVSMVAAHLAGVGMIVGDVIHLIKRYSNRRFKLKKKRVEHA